MADWREVLAHLVNDVETHFDRLKYGLAYRLGGPGPIKVVPYTGLGTHERFFLVGRVLEDPHIRQPRENDSIWRNLLSMYRRLESDEVPHAHLVVRAAGQEQEVWADEEGMFELWMELEQPFPAGPTWHEVDIELIEPLSDDQDARPRAAARIYVPPDTARYGVISDIDDTVLMSDAPGLLRTARTVFLRNAHTRMAFPGVAGFYRALHGGPDGGARNPMFYVSSSPWNLYDLLVDFFELNDVPGGPLLFLRNWGVTEEGVLPTHHLEYKLRHIRRIMDLYPDLPFIFLGDSAQEDPEIYHEVARLYEDRALAIYIRDLGRSLERREALAALVDEVVKVGSVLVIAESTLPMARHAAERGWITQESLADVADEAAKDEAPPTELERLLGESDEHEPGSVAVAGESDSQAQDAALRDEPTDSADAGDAP